MKKILTCLVLLALALSFAGCDSDPYDYTDTSSFDYMFDYSSWDYDNDTSEDASSYVADYNDDTSFEKALNDGAKVKGKIVQFCVQEYAPDSILGINCHAGEHLNFIFENEIDVETGDTIVVRITEEPSKVFLLDSWEVHCELFDPSETDNTSSDDSETSSEEVTEITMTMSEDDFKGMAYKDAKKKFKKMGFTKFDKKTVDTETKSSDDTICYIEITEIFFPNSDFEKGDKFDVDSTVTFYSYKYKEPKKPSPVFYSTNDYDTAKKGNTGVFSYKNKSGSYDVYWIIDFDAGYVYNFTEGNGDDSCDKVKIADGDLNDKITVTWHDGGDQWSWYLHFKYVNQPVTLIVNDHYGSEIEFTTTDLDDALNLCKTKTIKEYQLSFNILKAFVRDALAKAFLLFFGFVVIEVIFPIVL